MTVQAGAIATAIFLIEACASPPMPSPAVQVEPAAQIHPQAVSTTTEPAIEKGCGASNILDTVYFGFRKASLTPRAVKILRESALWMRDYADTTVALEGRADDGESLELSRKLAETRAETARDFLAKYGVSSNRMFVKATGIGTSSSDPHKKANQRCVSFVVEGKMLARRKH